MHGKSSDITIDPTDALFQGLPSRITVARYHSLVADPATMPEELLVTAHADDGTIMAVTHRNAPPMASNSTRIDSHTTRSAYDRHFLAGALHD